MHGAIKKNVFPYLCRDTLLLFAWISWTAFVFPCSSTELQKTYNVNYVGRKFAPPCAACPWYPRWTWRLPMTLVIFSCVIISDSQVTRALKKERTDKDMRKKEKLHRQPNEGIRYK